MPQKVGVPSHVLGVIQHCCHRIEARALGSDEKFPGILGAEISAWEQARSQALEHREHYSPLGKAAENCKSSAKTL